MPLSTDAHGRVLREVAPARIALSHEDHLDAPLCLQVALIRDLRRTVPVRPDPEEAAFPQRWDGDLSLDERTWWRGDWQAMAAPAKKTTAKLIPIVTTEVSPMIDAVELARISIYRWPAQENVIKDYLLPLGLDTNHGFAKAAVENSEVDKRRTHLEQRLPQLKHGRRAQASARPRPVGDGSASASNTNSAARRCIKNSGNTSSAWKNKTCQTLCSDASSRSARLRSMPNWNRCARKNGKPMNNATMNSASKNVTVKSNVRFSVY